DVLACDLLQRIAVDIEDVEHQLALEASLVAGDCDLPAGAATWCDDVGCRAQLQPWCCAVADDELPRALIVELVELGMPEARIAVDAQPVLAFFRQRAQPQAEQANRAGCQGLRRAAAIDQHARGTCGI